MARMISVEAGVITIAFTAVDLTVLRRIFAEAGRCGAQEFARLEEDEVKAFADIEVTVDEAAIVMGLK